LFLPARGLGAERESLADDKAGAEPGRPSPGPSGVIQRFFTSGYKMIARRASATRRNPPSTHHLLLVEEFILKIYLSPDSIR
jgi:hypothetical protein